MGKRAVPDRNVRRAINTKITDDLRAALEQAAEACGLTLSGEIERRLIASFEAETTEAMMRRVLVEDREAQRAVPVMDMRPASDLSEDELAYAAKRNFAPIRPSILAIQDTPSGAATFSLYEGGRAARQDAIRREAERRGAQSVVDLCVSAVLDNQAGRH